jgi:hypothetical protein
VRVFGDQILKIVNQLFPSNDLFAPLLMKGSGGTERKYFPFNKWQNVISKKADFSYGGATNEFF